MRIPLPTTSWHTPSHQPPPFHITSASSWWRATQVRSPLEHTGHSTSRYYSFTHMLYSCVCLYDIWFVVLLFDSQLYQVTMWLQPLKGPNCIRFRADNPIFLLLSPSSPSISDQCEQAPGLWASSQWDGLFNSDGQRWRKPSPQQHRACHSGGDCKYNSAKHTHFPN